MPTNQKTMGLGNEQKANINLVKLITKFGDTVDPKFCLLEFPDGGGKPTIKEKYNKVDGKIIAAEVREWEFEGQKNHEVKLTMVDDGEANKVQFELSSKIGRSIINSLLSIDKTNIHRSVKFGTWTSTSKKGNKSMTFGNCTVSLEQNDGTFKKVDWKISYDDQMALVDPDETKQRYYREMDLNKRILDEFLLWINECGLPAVADYSKLPKGDGETDGGAPDGEVSTPITDELFNDDGELIAADDE